MLLQAADRILTSFAAAGFCALLCCAAAVGQVPDEQSPKSDATESLADKLKVGTTLIYKDPETGEVYPLADAPAEMVKELQERLLLQKNVPRFDIQELDIKGEVSDHFVKLKVRLRIDLNVDGEWVRVPVGFDSFQLTDLAHTTEISDGRAALEKSRLPVKNWLLYGKGVHVLDLDLIGEAAVSQNGRWRLKPEVPRATISHLLLDLAEDVESVELSTEQPLQLSQNEETGNSTLETWGLSPATEITWRPALSMTGETVSVHVGARAQMTLDLATSSLVVDQPLTITGGSIDRLNVVLPAGFDTIAITGKNSEGEEIVRPADFSAKVAAVIEFRTPVTGSVTLHYDIGLTDSAGPQKIVLRLPDIQEVKNENGDLDLFVPVGLELEPPITRDVRPKRVDNSRGPRFNVFGYQLLSSDSRVEITVRETEAYYSVIPVISFETERNNILMTAQFSINMVRGSLNEIEVVWPGFEQGKWQVLHEYTRLIADDTITTLTGFDPENQKLRFPERMSGQFEVEMQAFRPRTTGIDGEGIRLFLPDVKSPAPHTTRVCLIESDEFSMSLRAQTQPSSFPLLPRSRWPEHLSNQEKPLTVRMVDSAADAVVLQVTPQQAEVKTKVDVALSIRQDRIYVSEKIAFDVRHLDLSEVRLNLPGVIPKVRFGTDDKPLDDVQTDGETVTYALPNPVRGEFILHIDYYWSPDSSSAESIEVPLVTPAVSDIDTETTVGTDVPELLNPGNVPDWVRVFSDEYPAAWRSSGRQTSFPVKLQHALRAPSGPEPQFVVLKSVLRGSGLVTSITGVYSKPVGSILFSVPENSQVIEGFIGKRHTASVEEVVTGDGPTRVLRVRADTGHRESQALTATLVLRIPLPNHSSLLNIWQPEMPRIVGISKDCNAIWVIGQSPESATIYSGLQMTELGGALNQRVFGRRNNRIRDQLPGLLAPYQVGVSDAVLELAGHPDAVAGDSQVLVGPVFRDAPVLVSLSRRMTLLLTAGVGLLVYFLFLRLRAISLITIVVVSCVSATVIAALVPGPGQLILIRIIPGCMIAVVAALLQRSFGQQRVSPTLTTQGRDQSTIFTVEKPVSIVDASTIVKSQTESAAETSDVTVA